MQSQEDEVAITEQDLEHIKERETAIRQLEVRARSYVLFDSVNLLSDPSRFSLSNYVSVRETA